MEPAKGRRWISFRNLSELSVHQEIWNTTQSNQIGCIYSSPKIEENPLKSCGTGKCPLHLYITSKAKWKELLAHSSVEEIDLKPGLKGFFFSAQEIPLQSCWSALGGVSIKNRLNKISLFVRARIMFVAPERGGDKGRPPEPNRLFFLTLFKRPLTPTPLVFEHLCCGL